MCWDGSTSTPADQKTRDARHQAHEAFDPIWKEGWLKRSQAYKELARLMKLTPDKTHIGMFNLQQCLEVHEHAATIMKGFEVNPERQAEIAQAMGAEIVNPEDMTERQKHLVATVKTISGPLGGGFVTGIIPPGAGKARRLVELTDHDLATRLVCAMRKRITHNQSLLANYYADDSKRDKSQPFISVEDAARLRGETMALIGVLDECGVTVAADGVAENVRLLEGS